GCPDSKITEENRGDVVTDADLDKAILPYSAAVWSLHVNNKLNPSLNLSKGARLGGIVNAGINDAATKWNPTDRAYQLNTDTVVSESNIAQATGVAAPPFPGIRYIYNVIDSAGPPAGFQTASQLFGFNNSAGSDLSNRPVCNGSEADPILSNGFATLSTANGPNNNNSNLAGSSCRFFQGVN
nr:hypothetical protein [Actinomycetota bacterium]